MPFVLVATLLAALVTAAAIGVTFVLFGLWRFYNIQPQFHTARELGDTLLRLAQRTDDPALAVLAHYAHGNTQLST